MISPERGALCSMGWTWMTWWSRNGGAGLSRRRGTGEAAARKALAVASVSSSPQSRSTKRLIGRGSGALLRGGSLHRGDETLVEELLHERADVGGGPLAGDVELAGDRLDDLVHAVTAVDQLPYAAAHRVQPAEDLGVEGQDHRFALDDPPGGCRIAREDHRVMSARRWKGRRCAFQ